MKRLYKGLIGILAGITAMSAFPVMAQDVNIIGEPCILNVYSSAEEDSEVNELEVSSLEIFGLASENLILVRVDGEIGYIKADELEAALPELDLGVFPTVEEMGEIGSNASAQALQENLISLGLLDGKADGILGPKSTEAITRFQEEHDLEVTGKADIYTLLLAAALGKGLEESVDISTKPFTSPEEKFPQIADNTDGDLSAYMDSKWRFHMDEFLENGEIDPHIEVGTFSVESPDIDRISGTLALKVLVQKDPESGVYHLIPAITTETSGAYRPYVQGAILVGEKSVRLEGGSSTGELNGITLEESGYIPLTDEAIELMQTGTVKTVRLIGKNTSYDIECLSSLNVF